MSELKIAPTKAELAAAEIARKLGAPQVVAEIDRRYSNDDGWIVMHELCDPATNRRVDALALHTYESRGMEMVGFEVKVTRGDWLVELKDPSKADPFARFCSRWWIVTPEGVVQPEELPAAWGHVVVRPGEKRAWRVAKKAPRLEARELTRRFFMVCLRGLERRFEKPITAKIAEAREAAYQEGQARCRADHRRDEDGEQLVKRHRELLAKCEEFHRTTGLQIHHPYQDVAEVGQAVRALERLCDDDQWALRQLEAEAEKIATALATVKSSREVVRSLFAQNAGPRGAIS